MKDALVQTLAALLTTALPAIGLWIGMQVKHYVAARAYTLQVEVIARRARAVAADIQRDVDGLKNPGRPGVWDAATAAAVRADAVARVRSLEPLACKTVLDALDGDTARLDALIGTHVEEAVRAMRQWETAPTAPTSTLANERALPRPEAPAPIAPAPANPQSGHIRAAALGVLLLISAGLLTTRCRPATDAGYALAGLPPATQCNAREYRCNAGIPEVCERGSTSTGALRWWPTVPPGPDGRRVPCARCVVDVDGGRAHCGAVDAALATDGGAP